MAPRSRAQLRGKRCRSADCPDDVAAARARPADEVGLVDDEAYAEMLVRSQQAGRGLARRALAHELRTKGIDPELAAETLDGIDEEPSASGPARLVAKKLRLDARAEPPRCQTRRLAGMLARKGYSSLDRRSR